MIFFYYYSLNDGILKDFNIMTYVLFEAFGYQIERTTLTPFNNCNYYSLISLFVCSTLLRDLNFDDEIRFINVSFEDFQY